MTSFADSGLGPVEQKPPGSPINVPMWQPQRRSEGPLSVHPFIHSPNTTLRLVHWRQKFPLFVSLARTLPRTDYSTTTLQIVRGLRLGYRTNLRLEPKVLYPFPAQSQLI